MDFEEALDMCNNDVSPAQPQFKPCLSASVIVNITVLFLNYSCRGSREKKKT